MRCSPRAHKSRVYFSKFCKCVTHKLHAFISTWGRIKNKSYKSLDLIKCAVLRELIKVEEISEILPVPGNSLPAHMPTCHELTCRMKGAQFRKLYFHIPALRALIASNQNSWNTRPHTRSCQKQILWMLCFPNRKTCIHTCLPVPGIALAPQKRHKS